MTDFPQGGPPKFGRTARMAEVGHVTGDLSTDVPNSFRSIHFKESRTKSDPPQSAQNKNSL